MTSCAGASVTLNGAASSDPDDDPLTYTWTENGAVIATGVNPTVILAYGTHTITLTVDDGKGGTATDTVVITVADTTPPVLTVTVTPNILWPANHKYVTVTPTTTVADACVATTKVKLLSVTSNEPDNGLGDGDMPNDIVINTNGTISLRAERSGRGAGRVYTITYQATDAGGQLRYGERRPSRCRKQIRKTEPDPSVKRTSMRERPSDANSWPVCGQRPLHQCEYGKIDIRTTTDSDNTSMRGEIAMEKIIRKSIMVGLGSATLPVGARRGRDRLCRCSNTSGVRAEP